MDIIGLLLASFVAWFISTLAGGGSPLILIPVTNVFLEAPAIAPIITIGMLLGNAQRVWLFWRNINWLVTFWYLPGAIVGAVLGAYVFTQIQVEWLELLMGSFLVIMFFSFSFGNKERTFKVDAWHFLPGGFLFAFISGLIGSAGPVLNPFYLNYGLVKEEMIATKSCNVVVVHIAKIATYASLGAMTLEHVEYGLLIGLAAIPANWVGQYVLKKMNDQQFRQIVVALMGISGIWMLWEQKI